MFRLIKQVFIVLSSFVRSLARKTNVYDNTKLSIQQTLTKHISCTLPSVH